MDKIAVISSLEHVACNLCGGEDTETIKSQEGFRMVRCRGCGLVYVTPRPTVHSLLSLYAGYHGRRGEDEASWDRLMSRIYRESVNLICSTGNGAGRRRLLDVGCGFGSFVAAMRARGWDAEGVDPSAAVVAAAARRGLPVRLGTLEEVQGESGGYDAVTMFYVLEHLSDPMRALGKALDLLAPGGTLLIRIPHTTPIVRLLSPIGLGRTLYDPPFHLYDFSPAVLQEMLRRTGFVDVQTFPAKSTVPSRLGARIASTLFGALAVGLYTLTRGTFLLPGVSKTTVARKPSD